uniref:Uncharacterized protein n=1 Tax=Zea mays TaxID=4577 RepID=A0A804M582_MAIZE
MHSADVAHSQPDPSCFSLQAQTKPHQPPDHLQLQRGGHGSLSAPTPSADSPPRRASLVSCRVVRGPLGSPPARSAARRDDELRRDAARGAGTGGRQLRRHVQHRPHRRLRLRRRRLRRHPPAHHHHHARLLLLHPGARRRGGGGCCCRRRPVVVPAPRRRRRRRRRGAGARRRARHRRGHAQRVPRGGVREGGQGRRRQQEGHHVHVLLHLPRQLRRRRGAPDAARLRPPVPPRVRRPVAPLPPDVPRVPDVAGAEPHADAARRGHAAGDGRYVDVVVTTARTGFFSPPLLLLLKILPFLALTAKTWNRRKCSGH